jgi:hypothetical protein
MDSEGRRLLQRMQQAPEGSSLTKVGVGCLNECPLLWVTDIGRTFLNVR